MIDRSRGSPALQAFFTDAFDGTLVHDFWAPYESIAAADRQYCLVHLLRGLDPIRTVTAALRTYIQTGELPPPASEIRSRRLKSYRFLRNS